MRATSFGSATLNLGAVLLLAALLTDLPSLAVAKSYDELGMALEAAANPYRDKSRRPELSKTVLVTSCNHAVMDLLMNWACHATALSLDYIVLAMDPALSTALSEQQHHDLVPHVYYGVPPELVRVGKTIEPERHNAWRRGQFNTLTMFKVRAWCACVRGVRTWRAYVTCVLRRFSYTYLGGSH